MYFHCTRVLKPGVNDFKQLQRKREFICQDIKAEGRRPLYTNRAMTRYIAEANQTKMKTLYALLILLVTQSGFAQVQQYPLVEWFTNTFCPICSSRNPALKAVYDKFEGRVHRLTIHPSVPFDQCPLFIFDRDGNGAREDFYQVRGTPTLYIDGVISSAIAPNFERDLEALVDRLSPLDVEVEDEVSGFNIKGKVKLKAEADLPAGTYRLHIALVERRFEFNANNGESEHLDVLRRFITPLEGMDVVPIAKGDDFEEEMTFQIPNGVTTSQTYLLAFVQNVESKAIINSGSRFSRLISSTRNQISQSEFTVSPNPLHTGGLQISSLGTYALMDLVVYNIAGQPLLERRLGGVYQYTDEQMQFLPAGVYFLRTTTGDGKFAIQKVVKY